MLFPASKLINGQVPGAGITFFQPTRNGAARLTGRQITLSWEVSTILVPKDRQKGHLDFGSAF
jgi:hypothetical protein